MKRFVIGIAALLPLLAAGIALADVINVPGDYAQIHDAVQAAQPGDVVQVAAGTYNDCTHPTEGPGSTPACVIMQPGVTLRGAGPEATIIDAEGLGRGIFVEDTDDVVIENLQVRGAYAEIYGAGILVRNGSTGVELRDLRIEANGDGGVVFIQDTAGLVERVSFIGNEAKQGGGLAIEEFSAATVSDCVFDGNIAPSGAGAFIRSGCTVTMSGCVIVNNEITADFGNGGGVAVQDAQCDISGCEIRGNTTRGAGGGLAYISGATGTVEDCEIVGNSTQASFNFGGGISCQQATPTLRNLLIAGNTATSPGSSGGGLDIQFSPAPTVENCTFVANSSYDSGNPDDAFGAGILVQWGAEPTIANCIIADSPAGRGIDGNFADTYTVTGCNLWNNAGGNEIGGIDGGCNFSADPLFCDAPQGDYHITAESPCAAGNHPDGDCGATYCGAYPAGCGDVGVDDLPTAGIVLGNMPNPFNPLTTIFFVLDEPGDVMVRIHDLRGRTVRSFHRSGLAAQTRHEIRWDGRDQDGRSLPSGVYLYRLDANGHSTSKRMSLIR
jgi:hypothetical protein